MFCRKWSTIALPLICFGPAVAVEANINVITTKFITTSGTGAWFDPFVRTTWIAKTGQGQQRLKVVMERGEGGTSIVGGAFDGEETFVSKFEQETRTYEWNKDRLDDVTRTNVTIDWGGHKNHLRIFCEYDSGARIFEQTTLKARQFHTDIAATLDPPNDATGKQIGTDSIDLKQWDSWALLWLEFEDFTTTDVVTTIKVGTEIVRTNTTPAIANPDTVDVTTTVFEEDWDPVAGVAIQKTTVTMSTEQVGAMPPPPLPDPCPFPIP